MTLHPIRCRTPLSTGLLAAVLLITLTACSGPNNPLSVGVDNIPSDVVVDNGQAPAPPVLIPPVAVGTGSTLPGLVALPPAVTSSPSLAIPPVAPALPCPALDPLAPLQLPVGNKSVLPPAPHLYTYRDSGSLQAPGSARPTLYPTTSAREVRNVHQSVQSDGSLRFTYDVVATEGSGNKDSATTTTYELVPDGQRPPVDQSEVPTGAINDSAPGLYITKIVTGLGAHAASFTPSPPMKLAAFPVVPGSSFDVVSTDGATTMTYRATVGPSRVVNACGSPVQAASISLDGTLNLNTPVDLNAEIKALKKCIGVTGLACVQDAPSLCPPTVPCPTFPTLPPTPPLPSGAPDPTGGGHTLDASGSTTFLATYGLALQYGGLSVFDDVDVTRQDATGPLISKHTSTISSVPVPTKRPAA